MGRIFCSVVLLVVMVSSIRSATNDAVVYVEARNPGETSRDAGDGVCVSVVEGRGIVLTCHHIVAGKSEVQVTFPSRKRFKGMVVAKDASQDVAAVAIDCPADTPYQPIADEDAKEGVTVTIIGDSSVNDQPIRQGKVIRPLKPGTPQKLQLDSPVHSGDSGGGVFDSEGRLVGLVAGSWTDDPKHRGTGPAASALKVALKEALK